MTRLLTIFISLAFIWTMAAAPHPAYASTFPTVDGTIDTGVISSSGATSLTVSHTVNGGLNNPVILIGIGSFSNSYQSVKWNGASTTQLVFNNSACATGGPNSSWLAMFAIAATSSGAGVVTVTLQASNTRLGVIVATLQDASGGAADASGCATGSPVTSISKAITTVTANDAIFDMVAFDTTLRAAVPGAGIFIEATTTNTTNSDTLTMGNLTAGANSITSYTMSRSTNTNGAMDIVVVAIKYIAPPAGGTPDSGNACDGICW